MSRFTVTKRHDAQGNPAVVEDPAVRQYRYLLRTAPADALEAAHTEVIPMLSDAQQQSLLETLRRSLLVGDDLTTDDHAKIAHLVTNGESRFPGQLLTALPAEVLHELAASVLRSQASFGLLGGYAHWDGAEPQPPDDSLWAGGGFDAKVGQTDPPNDPRRNEGFRFSGGGGG